jgi:hypothetical protein
MYAAVPCPVQDAFDSKAGAGISVFERELASVTPGLYGDGGGNDASDNFGSLSSAEVCVCVSVKRGLPYGKRDLLHTQKRPTDLLTYLRYTYIYMYICVCMYMYMYMYMYVCVYVYMYMYISVCQCMYTCMYVRMYVFMYVCTCVCMYEVYVKCQKRSGTPTDEITRHIREVCVCVKRDLPIWQKRPIHAQKRPTDILAYLCDADSAHAFCFVSISWPTLVASEHATTVPLESAQGSANVPQVAHTKFSTNVA